MLEDFFLTYANNLFYDDPENILKVFDEIIIDDKKDPADGLTPHTVEWVINFSKINELLNNSQLNSIKSLYC